MREGRIVSERGRDKENNSEREKERDNEREKNRKTEKESKRKRQLARPQVILREG